MNNDLYVKFVATKDRATAPATTFPLSFFSPLIKRLGAAELRVKCPKKQKKCVIPAFAGITPFFVENKRKKPIAQVKDASFSKGYAP